MLLRHGTTRKRAEELVVHGPLNFLGPVGQTIQGLGHEQGFFAAPVKQADDAGAAGTPSWYALEHHRYCLKYGLDHGGPVVLEIEVPDELIGEVGRDEAGKANNREDEIWFGSDAGLDYGWNGLFAAWPLLKKTIIDVPLKSGAQ